MFLRKGLLQNYGVSVKDLSKCARCGKGIDIFNMITRYSPDGTKVIVCKDCKTLYTEEERRQQLKMAIANAPKIKCPYCEQWFPKLTNEQYKDSAELDMLQYSIVPAWGVFHGGLKSESYIECPYCKMKIMQG
jgi:DNA-directed RNA polymerase subunit RPC12/RpoP